MKVERELATRPTVESGRISRTTLTEQLEQALRIDILEGVLRPGQRLRASEMTERYGVSATPLREALQRLAVENLVALDPRMGAAVAPISRDDLHDVYDMLETLDGMALERSMERADAGWIARVERSLEKLAKAVSLQDSVGRDTPDEVRREIASQWSAAHWDFHYHLYEACGSPWLLRFVRMVHQHSERYRMLSIQGRVGMHRDSRAEHERILTEVRKGDVQASLMALREHQRLTVTMLEDAFREHRFDPDESEGDGRW